MPSLNDFIAALKAGWFPALAAFVGCAVVLTGDQYSVPYLSGLPDWVYSTIALIGVFSISVLIANIAYIPIRIWNWYRANRSRKKYRAKIQKAVGELPSEEIGILAYLVTTGKRAFNAEYDDKRLSPLVSRGMIIALPGSHSILAWPYIVQEDVWDYLLENKESLTIDVSQLPDDPFHWQNRW